MKRLLRMLLLVGLLGGTAPSAVVAVDLADQVAYPAFRWRYETTSSIRYAPALAGDTAFVADFDGVVSAVDAETGDERWRVSLDNLGGLPLSASDGLVFVGIAGAEGLIIALDAETGDEVWRVVVEAGSTTPTAVDGTVYVTSGVQERFLRALDTSSGTERWKLQVDTAAGSSLAVEDGRVYVGSGSYLLALAAESGEQIWAERLGDRVGTTSRVFDGVIFARTFDGTVYAVDVARGDERWRYTPDAASGSLAPSAAGDMVYVTNFDGVVDAVDIDTGKRLWQTYLGAVSLSTTPLVVDGVVFVASSAGFLYALDAESGGSHWQIRLDGGVQAGLVEDDGTLYVATETHALLAIDPAEGKAPPEADRSSGEVAIADATTFVEWHPSLPAAPAFIGLWRLTIEPEAEGTLPSFAGPAMAYVSSGEVRVPGDVPEEAPVGTALDLDRNNPVVMRNEDRREAILLLLAIVPDEEPGPEVTDDGLSLKLVEIGEATSLPGGIAGITLAEWTVPAGAALPMELSWWPNLIAVESGTLDLVVAEQDGSGDVEAETLRDGDGALLPAETLRLFQNGGDELLIIIEFAIWGPYNTMEIAGGGGCVGRCVTVPR